MTNILNYFKTPPNFTVWNSHPNQPSEVIITAGMHGDELSSIEAAKSLIRSYKGKIPITIIPILNLASYEKYTSYNPLDKRDLIYLYPGNSFGSSSSKLMAQVSKLAKGKKLWIDLHGGDKDEHLKPFIWAPDPYPFLSHLKSRILVEPTYRKDVPYLILESGELGKINQKAITQHLNWISMILKNLNNKPKQNWSPTYNTVIYEKYSNQDSNATNLLWHSSTLYVSGKIT